MNGVLIKLPISHYNCGRPLSLKVYINVIPNDPYTMN